MRTPRELYSKKPIVYSCELNVCPQCGRPLKVAYVSGLKRFRHWQVYRLLHIVPNTVRSRAVGGIRLSAGLLNGNRLRQSTAHMDTM